MPPADDNTEVYGMEPLLNGVQRRQGAREVSPKWAYSIAQGFAALGPIPHPVWQQCSSFVAVSPCHNSKIGGINQDWTLSPKVP